MRIFQFRNSEADIIEHKNNVSKSSLHPELNYTSESKTQPSQSYFKRVNDMLNGSYYYFKPFILRKIQIFLRRILAKRKRQEIKDVWPIYPGSEAEPVNWHGWPQGKQFALILTHDVELKNGYNKVLKLMELEKKLGFVSSFYFIPERDYEVQKELLKKLRSNGFDYGVHGLKHDGKLFKNERIFSKRSIRINHYLREWDSTGFRAPAMHHNLKWVNSLNIKYDLSTFDTDPFEPQPDGVGTIFPFWVGENDFSKGYVEMPYTLPQDHSLFIILKEKNNQIWKDKLDWIAGKGGMALLDVHPDYLNFDDKYAGEEYPIKLYEDFLLYIKNKYSSLYWNVLPGELAKYYTDQSSI